VCRGEPARISFGDDASYSGPGPFNAFVLVKNGGGSIATDVVLAFEVVEGGEYFHEAVFGNGQLWWAHGAPDAGVIHVLPSLDAGGSDGVRLVTTMRPEWAPGARTVIRASAIGGGCVEPSSDEVLLTFSASAPTPAVASTATPPLPTATRVPAPTVVSTVLGVEENPTGAPRPSSTALPEGQIQPDDNGDAEDTGLAAVLVLAGVAIALVFLVVGVAVGRVLPR
jgi:hypothetical protein